MHAFQNIDFSEILNTFISLSTAFVMGALVGFERQYRQRTAGLRTNVLVSVGAAIFVDMAFLIAGPDGGARVASYVVSGVGFLGAGVIMREEGHVRGLNTAATLWGSAAIGSCAGADLIIEAVMATCFVLAANTLLRPLVNRINRLPVNEHSSEITHIIHLVVPNGDRQTATQALERVLKEENYPLAEMDIAPFSDDCMEIKATLLATSIDPADRGRVLARLSACSAIQQIHWETSVSE